MRSLLSNLITEVKTWDNKDRIIFRIGFALFLLISLQWSTFPLFNLQISYSELSELSSWIPAAQKDFSQLSPMASLPKISVGLLSMFQSVFGLHAASIFIKLSMSIGLFLVTFFIYKRSLPTLWSITLTYLSLISFSTLPFRDFMSQYLSGAAPALAARPEIFHIPFPSLSLFFFLILFYYSTQNKRFMPGEIMTVSGLWALQFYIHPVNALFGLVFWFAFLPFIISRYKAVLNFKHYLSCLILALVVIAPGVIGALQLPTESLHPMTENAGLPFSYFYWVTYFILPVLTSIALFVVFSLDTKEFIFRFGPVFILLFIEGALLTAHMFNLKTFSPELVFSRISLNFVHIYSLVPILYFFTVKLPSLHLYKSAQPVLLFQKVSDFVFNRLSYLFLPIVSLGLLFFSYSIFSSRTELERLSKFHVQVNESIQRVKDLCPTRESGVVFSPYFLDQITMPIFTKCDPGVSNVFVSADTETVLKRFVAYAKVNNWTDSKIHKWLQPGGLSDWLPQKSIILSWEGAENSGLGYWLVMHRSSIALYEDLAQKIPQLLLDTDSTPEKLGVKKVLLQSELPISWTPLKTEVKPYGTLYYF